MKFFLSFDGVESEITEDKYIEVVHSLNFITEDGFYPGSFRANALSGRIDGYKVFTITWWSVCQKPEIKFPFPFRVISEALASSRVKCSAEISAESVVASRSILLHFMPSADIVRIK